jgi:hypothetical protein
MIFLQISSQVQFIIIGWIISLLLLFISGLGIIIWFAIVSYIKTVKIKFTEVGSELNGLKILVNEQLKGFSEAFNKGFDKMWLELRSLNNKFTALNSSNAVHAEQISEIKKNLEEIKESVQKSKEDVLENLLTYETNNKCDHERMEDKIFEVSLMNIEDKKLRELMIKQHEEMKENRKVELPVCKLDRK